MALTEITITGMLPDPDGNPGSGVGVATLSHTITTVDGDIIHPAPVAAKIVQGVWLAADGVSPFKLVPNDASGTLPPGSTYQFTVQVDGAPVDSFAAVVHANAADGTVDLSALMPVGD